MAMRRILLDNGSFVNYNGPAPVTKKIMSESEKIRERQDLDDKASKGGFKPENPVVGGLTEADKRLVADGKMGLIDLVNLANTRKIVVPKDMDSVEAISAFLIGGDVIEKASLLSEDIKEKIRAGISIPEMRKLAKEAGIKIPKDKSKAIDMKEYLLQDEEDEDEL